MITKLRLTLVIFIIGSALWGAYTTYSATFAPQARSDALIRGERLRNLIENEPTKLTSKQVKTFFKKGYLVVPGFFTKEEVSTALASATKLQQTAEELVLTQIGKVLHKGTQFVIDRVEGKVQIHRIVWAGAAEPELLQLSTQKKLLVPVAQLLDSNRADHLVNQLHYKLPHDRVSFRWHQAVQNRRQFDPDWQDLNGNGSFVQAIIALDRMTTENGAIFIVPNSHRSGDLFLDLIADNKELESKAGISRATPIEMAPGDLLLMHPALVHSSKANESSAPRRTLLNGFAYPGANHEPYPGEGSAQEIELIPCQELCQELCNESQAN